MNDTKSVQWFTDDDPPNTFFFRSPFRSWKFLINTLLLILVSAAFVIVAWKFLGASNRVAILAFFLVQSAIYPYWGAIRRHAKINEIFQAGRLPESPAGSPINELLEVADNALNESLRNTLYTFGILLCYVYILLQHQR